MKEAGLPDKWREQFQTYNGNHCLTNGGTKQNKKAGKKDQSITLKNLSGSFVVLLVGIFFSIILFIIELILYHRKCSVVAVLPVPNMKTDSIAEDESSTAKQLTSDAANNDGLNKTAEVNLPTDK